MGFFDKLKNVFFEEEYVEVEESPVKKEKVTVAKKIETPEVTRRVREEVKPPVVANEVKREEVVREVKPEPAVSDFRFPVTFDDKDFEVEEKKEAVKEVPVVEPKPVMKPVKQVVEVPLYEKRVTTESSYTSVYSNANNNHNSEMDYHGLYEGGEKRDKKNNFTPSLIISPVYGILDKNYKKEEIVSKKEIRLSVSSSKKVDLDSVREKAYGDLANDITASMNEEEPAENEKKEPEKVSKKTQEDFDNLLYDLNEDESPKVKTVTMGDAEEYFNDLGLEYNVDYKVEKDSSPSEVKKVTRRSEKNKNIESEDIIDNTKNDTKDKESDDNSNLFDLIDSMYDDDKE